MKAFALIMLIAFTATAHAASWTCSAKNMITGNTTAGRPPISTFPPMAVATTIPWPNGARRLPDTRRTALPSSASNDKLTYLVKGLPWGLHNSDCSRKRFLDDGWMKKPRAAFATLGADFIDYTGIALEKVCKVNSIRRNRYA